jgi:hypothetical protein
MVYTLVCPKCDYTLFGDSVTIYCICNNCKEKSNESK